MYFTKFKFLIKLSIVCMAVYLFMQNGFFETLILYPILGVYFIFVGAANYFKILIKSGFIVLILSFFLTMMVGLMVSVQLDELVVGWENWVPLFGVMVTSLSLLRDFKTIAKYHNDNKRRKKRAVTRRNDMDNPKRYYVRSAEKKENSYDRDTMKILYRELENNKL